MDSRLSFLLLVLVISFVSTNARSLVTLDDFAQGDQDPNEGLRGSWELCSTAELSSINEQDLNVCRFPFQCKKLVLQYVPSILIDAEKFLETTDVCTAIYACKNSEDHIASMLADM
ncbi:hypothetical protein B296_00007621 [Ensete ventricosum]|uniref:Saposin B type region 2 domain-containing protein n=1 Tax=Ensete ventricosum TaxID=4639 RepID=A0A426ZZV4_ENSVE|nr:hypothetical protein B296_00007621 [Ensete ventricosum]